VLATEAAPRLALCSVAHPAVSVCPPYHSVEPVQDPVYHNNTSCSVGKAIWPAYLRSGIGIGRRICDECVTLALNVWTVREQPPAPDTDE
jgi:hypothetical protein